MAVVRSACVALMFALLVPLALEAQEQAKDAPPPLPKGIDVAMVASCQADLLALRGLAAPVVSFVPWPAARKSAFVDQILDREFPEGRAEPLGRLYEALGLLPRDYALRATLRDYLDTQKNPIYWDLQSKTVLVADLSETPEIMIGRNVFTQIGFALQDRQHDLVALHAKPLKAENDDALLAAKFLSEGEAQYLFVARFFKEAKNEDPDAVGKAIENMASVSRAETEARARKSIASMGEKGKALSDTMDKLARLPLFLYRRFVDPGLKGAVMIERIKKTGGWDAVDALWKEPPVSTTQALRPEKKLVAALREDPSTIELGDLSATFGAGWKRTVQTTVGELGLESLITEQLDAKRAKIAPGTRGDRAQAYVSGDRTAAVWHLVFGKPEWAELYAVTYTDILAHRFPEATTRTDERDGNKAMVFVHEDGSESAVTTHGTSVAIVVGCPSQSLDAVLAATLGATVTVSKEHPPLPPK
jgi:hypothetical protein